MPVTAKLSRVFYEKLGDDLTNELVNWFNEVDTTYRTDLRDLNELNFARFDAKLEQRAVQLEAKLDQRINELRTEFGQSRGEMQASLARLEGGLLARIGMAEGRLARLTVILWLSALGALALIKL